MVCVRLSVLLSKHWHYLSLTCVVFFNVVLVHAGFLSQIYEFHCRVLLLEQLVIVLSFSGFFLIISYSVLHNTLLLVTTHRRPINRLTVCQSNPIDESIPLSQSSLYNTSSTAKQALWGLSRHTTVHTTYERKLYCIYTSLQRFEKQSSSAPPLTYMQHRTLPYYYLLCARHVPGRTINT